MERKKREKRSRLTDLIPDDKRRAEIVSRPLLSEVSDFASITKWSLTSLPLLSEVSDFTYILLNSIPRQSNIHHLQYTIHSGVPPGTGV
jgi:hypothetical protein